MSSEVSPAGVRPQLLVFVASPGDVAEERQIAHRVLQRLANQFAPWVRLEPVFWEHEPLLASASFQETIPQPADTDIVVCILWSRLGTRLPKHITRPGGGPYLSGTEYEVETAIEARKHREQAGEQPLKPDLVVYRKTAEPIVSLKDRHAARQAVEQCELLDEFVHRFFHGEDGTLVAAFNPFDSTADFEARLEEHLRKLIERRLTALGMSLSEESSAIEPTWKDCPFRGLDVFEFEHQEIFFGRTQATSDVIGQLRLQAEAGRAFLMVLGASGCGKSSLVRAGVLPLLVQPGVIEGVGLWRRAIMRPSDRLTLQSSSGKGCQRRSEIVFLEPIVKLDGINFQALEPRSLIGVPWHRCIPGVKTAGSPFGDDAELSTSCEPASPPICVEKDAA